MVPPLLEKNFESQGFISQYYFLSAFSILTFPQVGDKKKLGTDFSPRIFLQARQKSEISVFIYRMNNEHYPFLKTRLLFSNAWNKVSI
jgi:hypothetical protein